jgi:hypothetical protein
LPVEEEDEVQTEEEEPIEEGITIQTVDKIFKH